jgi:tRNA pseudouridine38-40 synthase
LRYFIKLGYKGTNYHGWQLQPNAITVQELVNKALSLIFRTEINVVGAGRTDTGVHAEQLYAHIDITSKFDIDETLYKLNGILPKDIVVWDILKTTDTAHARFDAVQRSYEYRILQEKNPFFIDTTWQLINKKLNLAKMNEAAEILLNYTDFECFSRSNSDVKNYNCDVTRAEWIQNETSLIFYISANRFLRNMVRAIVGTLIDVGLGKTTIEDFNNIILSKDRRFAGASVPPQGLFLSKIDYPNIIFINE